MDLNSAYTTLPQLLVVPRLWISEDIPGWVGQTASELPPP